MNVQKVLLKNYTSLRIGGEANMMIVHTENELVEAVMHAKSAGLRVHILGGGTNTFFEETLSGILILKMEIVGIELQPSTVNQQLLTIKAGEMWDDVVKYTVEHNLWGIENLSLIPGTVGGAPVQNIGAYGVELKDVFVSLHAYDCNENVFRTFSKEECRFGYRDSIFKREAGRYIITQVTLSLSKLPTPVLTYAPLDVLREKQNCSLQEVRNLVVKTRQEKLPNWEDHPNAGSFFKNPIVSELLLQNIQEMYSNLPFHKTDEGYKIPAAWLIEHVAQMKGVQEENIGTWPKQPLVLVNYVNTNAEADGEKLMRFSQKIIDTIFQKTGITLEREVQFCK